MCLGVPGKIVRKWYDKKSQLWMADVDFNGIKKEICLDYSPDSEVDDYVLVHVGFALSKVATS